MNTCEPNKEPQHLEIIKAQELLGSIIEDVGILVGRIKGNPSTPTDVKEDKSNISLERFLASHAELVTQRKGELKAYVDELNSILF